MMQDTVIGDVIKVRCCSVNRSQGVVRAHHVAAEKCHSTTRHGALSSGSMRVPNLIHARMLGGKRHGLNT